MASLATLPPEVLLMIGKQLTVQRLVAFASTCNAIRTALKPLLLEYIYFPSYDADKALACLKHLSLEVLRHVTKIAINLVDYNVDSEADLHRTWINIIQCLPSLREIVFHISTSGGRVTPFLQPSSLHRLLQDTFPLILKTQPIISFCAVVRSDTDERCTMFVPDVQELVETFKYLPGRLRIVLLAAALDWEDGMRPPNPRDFLNALADTNAEIHQVPDPVIVHSNPCLRTMRPWLWKRCLDLKGIEITLNNALALIRRTDLDLHKLSLSLICIESEDGFSNIALPDLASLELSCANYSWFLHLSEEERTAYLHAVERFFKVVSMPSLRVCTLDVPAWVFAKTPELLTALANLPSLCKLKLEHKVLKLSGEKERLLETQNLIAKTKLLGITTNLEVEAITIRPSDPMLESRFEEWLPWYSSLHTSITKLELTFKTSKSTQAFPSDLMLDHYLEFPILESLALEFRDTKSKFFQASRICSKIRAWRLRHLEVTIYGRGGEPLLHAILALLPEYTSLVTFRVTAPESCLKEMNGEWETLCKKLDISYAYDYSHE